MAAEFVYLYPYPRAEAQRRGEVSEYEASFRENVTCARAIEQVIRAHFREDSGTLAPGCAEDILQKIGFRRTLFVLSNTLRNMGCPELVGEEVRAWGQRTYVPPDGKYDRYFTVDTAAGCLESFLLQTKAAYQTLELFGPEHCAGGRYTQDYKGKVLVLSPDALRERCWDSRNQLWLAEMGFGCSPTASGRAVYATCLGDGEKARWNRHDFTGVLDGRYMPEWAREKLLELGGCQEKNSPDQGGMEMK